MEESPATSSEPPLTLTLSPSTLALTAPPAPDLFQPSPPGCSILEPELVPVILVRNCGILIAEESETAGNGTTSNSNGNGSRCLKKKDSIFQLYNPSHKIPVEIRRSERTRTSKKGWKRYGGVIFGLVSSFAFSLTVLLAKVLRDDHNFHPICVTFWRYVGILGPALPIVLYFQCFTGENVFDSIWPLNTLRNFKHCCVYAFQGLFGCTAIIFRFYSLEFMSLADSTVISYSSPVFVTILAHFYLGEKFSVVSIFVTLLTVSGVCVIARPSFFLGVGGSGNGNPKLWIGVLFALFSMACSSGLLILLRNIRQTHFSLMLLVSGGWGVAQSGILSWSLQSLKLPEGERETFLIGVLALLTFVGQVSIILALKYENAGPVSVLRCSEVFFAFLWQFQFFGVYPDLFSCVGAAAIILGVVLVSLVSWVKGLPPDYVQSKKSLMYLTK